MNTAEIIKRSTAIREQQGGQIFAMPLDEADPNSKYVISMYAGDEIHVFPDVVDISEAAVAVVHILDALKEEGLDSDYARNVRFAMTEAQLNSPDVRMHELKGGAGVTMLRPQPIGANADFTKREDGSEGVEVSARGLLKMCYIEMVDSQNKNAARLMEEYYKLLALNRYGKSATAIRQEVSGMSKDQVLKWIESTHARFIRDDLAFVEIFVRLTSS